MHDGGAGISAPLSLTGVNDIACFWRTALSVTQSASDLGQQKQRQTNVAD
jgi:hypothetical protein